MSRGKAVEGFCYVTDKPVSMPAGEWRAKYPGAAYLRRVENGETFYTSRPSVAGPRGPRLAAEAYAIIPEGK